MATAAVPPVGAHEKVKGAVPPIGVTVALPLAHVPQVALDDDAELLKLAELMLTVVKVVHAFASFANTVYVPAQRLFADPPGVTEKE